ncbi:hypothetical protein CARUB_v10012510mg [Capsella rubella]|uniref:At2g29880-like C-terminal domain-containing protein n=1 Tax=Capsella rubella TaxID=81985 RepID=R0ILG3_9BRAS|nr:hypothetical protein CARUB_v10012510mg [Capsella rubella]
MSATKSFFCQLFDSLRFSSGFGWDPETKKFTPTYEVWDDFLKDLRIIFESTSTATGHNAVGLGNPIDGGPNQVGDTDAINQSSHDQMVNDVECIPYDERSVYEVFSSLENSRLEKLPPPIKEIHDLTDDMHNEAMTMVHSLCMKFLFVHISIEERKGWII